MIALRSALSQAEGGSGVTTLITGPGGIGKTALLRWLEDVANDRKLFVRWGYCLPEIREPFFAMEQLFRSMKGKGPGVAVSEVSSGSEASSSTGSKSRPRVTPKGVALAFVPIAKEAETKGAAPVARAPSNVLLDYLSMVESECIDHPCVILLDDFQWADPDSVQALRFLSRNIKRLPVLLAVAFREDEVMDTTFHQILRDLRKEGLARDMALAGLKERDALQLLERVVQAPLEPTKATAAVHLLMELTGGNPFFFLEVVHLWQEMGLIRKEGQKVVIHVPAIRSPKGIEATVPESVSELLTKKLDSLSREERDILEGAAILGQEFEAAPLEELFMSHGESFEGLLRKLSSRRGLIVQKGEDGTRYAFAHTLLWETVKDSTTEEQRKHLAGHMAAWWEEHLPADVERMAALYELGGLNAKALSCVEKVITVSLQMHAHERVVRGFDKGLVLMQWEGTPVEEMVKWGLAVVDRLREDGGDARWVEPMCRPLLQANPPEPLSWEVLVRLVNSMITGRVREARQLLNKVIEATRLKPELASKTLLGRIASINGRLLYLEGQIDASIESERNALSLLPEEAKFLRGSAYQRIGWSFIDKNRNDDAIEFLEKGLAVAKEGKVWGLIPSLLNLRGGIALSKGNLTTAEEVIREATATCKALGQIQNLTIFLSNLSIVREDMGILDGAEDAAREALRVSEAFGERYAQATAAQALGAVMVLKRAPREAMPLFEKARDIFKESGDVNKLLDVQIDMTEVKGIMGDPSGALEALKAVLKEERNLKQEQVVRPHLLRARFAMETGAKEEARAEVELALGESRRWGLRYWEGRAQLVLAGWEKKYGTPEKAAETQRDAEKMLKECGVTNLAPFAWARSEPRDEEEVVTETDAKPRPQLSLMILRYLSEHGGVEGVFGPTDVVPIAFTQKGISEGLGLPRDRFSMALKRLEERGLVAVQTHAVRGESRALKVYLLTQEGKEVAKK
jgi:tetratricopeptide (TPR) repeat protein